MEVCAAVRVNEWIVGWLRGCERAPRALGNDLKRSPSDKIHYSQAQIGCDFDSFTTHEQLFLVLPVDRYQVPGINLPKLYATALHTFNNLPVELRWLVTAVVMFVAFTPNIAAFFVY